MYFVTFDNYKWFCYFVSSYCCDFCNILLVIHRISFKGTSYLICCFADNKEFVIILIFSTAQLCWFLSRFIHPIRNFVDYYSFYMLPLGAETECKDFSTTFFFLLEINFTYKLSSNFFCVLCEIAALQRSIIFIYFYYFIMFT